MESRGPDATGVWEDKYSNIIFGHKRLSIIDINARSNQPMESNTKRFVITYNGEIYNFKELRSHLERKNCLFSTDGDTEVLLHLFELYGSEMLSMLRGMFALAIWDKEKEELFIARDPYGIKPLYVANINGSFIFASQVKALIASNLLSQKPCIKGRTGYWLYGSVPEPYTWFNDIKAFPPGCYSTVSYTHLRAHET